MFCRRAERLAVYWGEGCYLLRVPARSLVATGVQLQSLARGWWEPRGPPQLLRGLCSADHSPAMHEAEGLAKELAANLLQPVQLSHLLPVLLFHLMLALLQRGPSLSCR